MILFREDWAKYPGAIVHVTTKNESFLRYASLLKYMGIDNHAFCLALHNPLLKDVDPHDDNLSLEIQTMIAVEARDNFWYHIREIARVPPPAGNEPIQFRANRANMAFFWLFFNHITQMLIQIRQTGKSLTANELNAWLAGIGITNADISLLTKDDKLRNKTSIQIREIMDLFPSYLKMIHKSDIKNSERITVKKLSNMINIYVGRTDKKAADNTGRGMTTPIVEIDEFAYVPNIAITLPVILAATTDAREVADRAGVPYGTFFLTTPGKLYSESGRFAKKMYDAALRWSEEFFDLANREALETLVEKNGGRTGFQLILVEFNHRQLGYTDQWLKKRIATALSEGDDVESDFLNKWVGSGANSPISKDLVAIIKDSEKKTSRVEISEHGYITRWYVSEQDKVRMQQKGFLILGFDSSDAVGQDGMGLVYRFSEDASVVGAGDYNETNLTLFSDFLSEILINHNSILFIPERRSSAVGIMDNLITILATKGVNPFKKIFNWLFQDGHIYKDKFKEIFANRVPSQEVLTKCRKYLGFATSGGGATSRTNLYGNIFNASIKYAGNLTRDPLLIQQLLSLEIRNGRIDHAKGSHDDMVIAWLLAYWFLVSGNGKKYYNITEGHVLKSVIDNELLAGVEGEDLKVIKEQELLRHNINQLVDSLKSETHEHIALRILNKIRMLEAKINKRIIKNFNLDSLLKEIKIIKRITKLENTKVKYY